MDNKRKLKNLDIQPKKKSKLNEICFDGKEKLNSFNEYLNKVDVLKNNLNELANKKKKKILKMMF